MRKQVGKVAKYVANEVGKVENIRWRLKTKSSNYGTNFLQRTGNDPLHRKTANSPYPQKLMITLSNTEKLTV